MGNLRAGSDHRADAGRSGHERPRQTAPGLDPREAGIAVRFMGRQGRSGMVR